MSDKPARQKKRPGRPTVYNPRMATRAEKLAGQNKTRAEIAKALGITYQTLLNYERDHEAFFEALMRGRESLLDRTEVSLYQRAQGWSTPEERVFMRSDGEIVRVQTTRHYPPDTPAIKYILSSMRGDRWTGDRLDLTSGGGPLPQIVIALPSPSQSQPVIEDRGSPRIDEGSPGNGGGSDMRQIVTEAGQGREGRDA